MNVIFLDFDGVINTFNSVLEPFEDKNAVEKRIKILGDICKEYNCKIVIESSHKTCIDEETLETDVEWINDLFDSFKKYGIEVIGRTKDLHSNPKNSTIWKEDEILEYLNRHPEIEHFCVLDDDDLVTIPDMEKKDFSKSDLNKVRDYLVTPLLYSETDPNESGLLESHKKEVGKILKKEYRNKRKS